LPAFDRGHERQVEFGSVQPASPDAYLEEHVVRFRRRTASMNGCIGPRGCIKYQPGENRYRRAGGK
jgi:hypothetical protein